jgi:imidazolonepropionase-like amidohydrolase
MRAAKGTIGRIARRAADADKSRIREREGAMRKFLAAAGVAALALGLMGQAPAPPVTHIWAGALIAKPGEARLTAQTIIVRGGRIEAVRPGYVPAPAGGQAVDLKNRTVLPGLIDCHVHLLSELAASGRLDAVTKEESDYTLDGLSNARKTLMAGFTTVVDLGAGQGGHAIFALRDQIAAGKEVGPRILAAGSTISPTGGHADVHGYREDVMHVLGRESICNGADDCRRAVREQAKLGANIIKVTATAGVLSNTAQGLGQQFFDDELKAIADSAHLLGLQVTAHAHGKPGIDAALRAGFDSIEHGSYGDAGSFALYRQTGAYLVPTVLAGITTSELAKAGGVLTPAQAEKALQVGPVMLEMLRQARLAGVKVAFGTDSGVSRHGDNARELELMVQAGYTPTEALRSATVTAAEHLKLESTIGAIEAGKSADIIAVAGDPTRDIAVMRDVRFVMARGTVAKRE